MRSFCSFTLINSLWLRTEAYHLHLLLQKCNQFGRTPWCNWGFRRWDYIQCIEIWTHVMGKQYKRDDYPPVSDLRPPAEKVGLNICIKVPKTCLKPCNVLSQFFNTPLVFFFFFSLFSGVRGIIVLLWTHLKQQCRTHTWMLMELEKWSRFQKRFSRLFQKSRLISVAKAWKIFLEGAPVLGTARMKV